MVTAKEVANMAGVSVATVSQILNAKAHRYNKETQARVLAAVAKLGYKPNSSARILAGGKTKTIGLIISSTQMLFHEEHYSQLVSRVADLCNQNGYAIYWICMTKNNDANLQIIRSYGGRGIEHFIFFGIPSGIAPIVDEIETQQSTWILYGDRWRNRYVGSDSMYGSQMLIRYFLEQGIKNFKMAIPVSNNTRLQALCSMFPDTSPHTLEEKYICHMEGLLTPFSIDDFVKITNLDGYRATEKIMLENPDIQGIIYMSDYYALGGAKYFYEHGISIGTNLRLAGFNNIHAVKCHVMPIISVEHQIAEIAQLLFENVMRPGDIEILVKPELIIR